MNLKTELKFISFDSLLNSVLVDFRILNEEGMVEPAQLIEIAQRVNYDLGLKIHQTKETLIDIDNHVAKLPTDFYTLNFALLMGHFTTVTPNTWGGRVTENVDVNCNNINPDCLLPQPSTCHPQSSCDIEPNAFGQNMVYSICGRDKCVKVIQHINNEVREYSYYEKLHIKQSRFIDPGSLNCKLQAAHTAEIKDGYIYVSIPHGKLYISYQGELVDDQGNLLVLDHPEIIQYYKSAMGERILRNLYFGGEDVKQKYDEIKDETRRNRVRALSIVNTPNFEDLRSMWALNRKSMYARYYNTWHTNVFETQFKLLPF